MNNGRPPYGDPSLWGSQQGQQPVQPGMNQPTQTGYDPYQQPWQQTGAQQVNVPQQTWQQNTYAQQTAYPQQNAYSQQNAYPQQNWQPYTQNQQTYQQQPWGQTQAQYPQFNQMGQQMYPNQGYSGYVSQPQARPSGVSFETVAKVLLYGVVPVLFVVSLFQLTPVLNWLLLAAAIGAIVLMWLRDVVSPNMRLTLSAVYAVVAVVAIVGVFAPPAKDKTNNGAPVGQVQNGQNQNSGLQNAADLSWEATAIPTATPSATPDPQANSGGAALEQLNSFFYFWSVNNDENMVALTPPSWRREQENSQQALFQILTNRVPLEYEITNITGTDNDTTRTAIVKCEIDKHNGNDPDRYSFKIVLLKEDGVWYVDPRSLKSYEKETPTPATVNTTPTQPPLYTGTPSTILYFNPNGGSYYHLDPYCSEVAKKFTPLEGSFYFSDLSDPTSPYAALKACNVCGAPIPD